MLKINDLLHRKNDFVGVVTDVREDAAQVYVAYYKWMPYDNPDNKTGGMSGWYHNGIMELFKTDESNPIWRTCGGFPPEYVPAGHELIDEDEEDAKIRSQIALYLSDYSVPEDQELVDVLTKYVLGLLR